MFTIPCAISNVRIKQAMLDLGASINFMSLSIYFSSNLDPLKEAEIVIQLANRSNSYPKGVLEDVLVQVEGLIFLVDIYIVNMEDDKSPNPAPIFLEDHF